MNRPHGPCIKPTLTCITRDPFCKPWKRAGRTFWAAKERGWEVIVALDSRSCFKCQRDMGGLISRQIDFTPTRDSCDEMIDPIVRHATRPMVLMIADDEEPSPGMWCFAEHPPALANYAVKVVTPTPDGRVYILGTEFQCRLVNPKMWNWVGGIDGHDDVHGQGFLAEDKVIWHFATYAPREVREVKLANYKTLGADDNFGDRHIYERRPDAIIGMSKELKAEWPA